MYPLLAAWNCTPRSTALVSAASTAPGGAASCQMLHGHWATAPVVKLHENGLLIGVPEAVLRPRHRRGIGRARRQRTGRA